MLILSIETSCDDTGVAITEKRENGEIKVRGSALSSQDGIHKKWGGVYPFEAKRAHQRNLVPTLIKALEKADLLEEGGVSEPEGLEEIFTREKTLLEQTRAFFKKYQIKKEIDKIAVTKGPGLEPCLFAGINFAKALSLYLEVPIIPVNHIKAHVLFFLKDKKEMKFPAITLIVSGGHTELILMHSPGSFELLGGTRDDAAGECFDKTARILGLGYPGGPAIATKAAEFEIQNSKFEINLPRPMINSNDYDFSFSGLKTAVLYDVLSQDEKTKKSEEYVGEMAKEIEEAITDVLISKSKKAMKDHGTKTLIMGGGVTANQTLQEKAKNLEKEFPGTEVILPSPELSTDNAEIIGIAATAEKEEVAPENLGPDANLKMYDRM